MQQEETSCSLAVHKKHKGNEIEVTKKWKTYVVDLKVYEEFNNAQIMTRTLHFNV